MALDGRPLNDFNTSLTGANHNLPQSVYFHFPLKLAEKSESIGNWGAAGLAAAHKTSRKGIKERRAKRAIGQCWLLGVLAVRG